MKTNLSDLRKDISALFHSFRTLLETRQALVQKIIQLKNETGMSHFDYRREVELFSSHKDWPNGLSLKEVLAYSLIMEGQQNNTNYPRFSEREHLAQNEGQLFEMINPIMLKIWFPEYFKCLKLTERFDFIRNI